MTNRRQFLKATGLAGAGLVAASRMSLYRAIAAAQGVTLLDPASQPKFMNPVPNALHPSFLFRGNNARNRPNYEVGMYQFEQNLGLVDPGSGAPLATTVWGFGDRESRRSFPGKTFEVQSGDPITVRWTNNLPNAHLLPVDTSLHWCYSLPGYDGYSIGANGVPVVTHLHGGHSESASDGLPEAFFTPGFGIKGPQWVKEVYSYDNDQPATNLWYHDHALGITRLNVYAGLAGFYFIRDGNDNGKPNNPLGLPAFPYEVALAVQDRMFSSAGQLFYPAFPGDPAYDDFITEELPPDVFPGGGPTVLAEFFGDHIMVNGVVWPKMDVEPRNYRLHLLNGSDSRFYALRFRAVPAGATDLSSAGDPIPFWIVGSDQGIGTAAQTDMLIFEPGGRYDVVFNFAGLEGQRIIVENLGGDEPFGGDIPGPQAFGFTDRIMAFDVVLPFDASRVERFDPAAINFGVNVGEPVSTRQVALFEGKDEYGRLQPLLGAFVDGEWKALTWHAATTENPALGATEEWEIYNFTMDAHPIHLHLVHFQIVGRGHITFTAVEDGQEFMTHTGATGHAPAISDVVETGPASVGGEYYEAAPKDMVTALPDQVTRIRATFDRPGRYVWHCHILSHEDHEMMRVLHVGPGA